MKLLVQPKVDHWVSANRSFGQETWYAEQVEGGRRMRRISKDLSKGKTSIREPCQKKRDNLKS